jgi:aminoglycoside 6-adenylyltransferase
LDKDGILPLMVPSPPAAQRAEPPTLPEFQEVICDFWFHVVWAAKKLKRGELWTAKFCCDVYMKRLLLRMVEWHTRATVGWDADVRYGGRFLERWADSRVLTELSHAFSRYDADDVWRALFATATLFRRIAEETAQQLSYDWQPEQADEAMKWASKHHS